MLLVLMFHKVTEPLDCLAQFETFLLYLKSKYSFVLPGDKLPFHQLSICLTFDDAYADFYFKVYPLLKKHKIPAIVAVPTAYIIDSTNCSSDKRMDIIQSQAMQGDNYLNAPFCTWEELREISQSPWVKIASHHHSHMSVKDPNFDLSKEMINSKKILEKKLEIPIDTLVYPYGHYLKQTHQKACDIYRYIMRISYASNFSWGGENQLIYRVNADPFWTQNKIISLGDQFKWFLKFCNNRLRGR
ncbi:polysaccharide deacetylase family protein [Thiotrichales bacterium 19S11-10]|nr:polysaccharide deacetylase family protein [Thiotrichales bacterium 19S11-10]